MVESCEAMDVVKKAMGNLFPDKGYVWCEDYEMAKEDLRSAKQQVKDNFSKGLEDDLAWDRAWPFDD
jgi:hypothetical protein